MRSRLFATTACLLVGLGAQPAFASQADQPSGDGQPADAQPAPAGSAENRSGDIVVTARRRAENLQDTPVAITALSANDLAIRSVQQVTDLTTSVPGMSINQNQAAPMAVTFQLRGLSQVDLIAALDPPVGVYVDGVLLNANVGILGTSFLDVERIEVLKGPQGTLYGRNTTAGAINFYTNQPTDVLEGQVTLGYGNYDAYQASGVLNLPIAEGAALRIVGEASGHGGYATNVVNGHEVGDLDSHMVRATLRLQPASGLTISLRGDYSRSQSNGGAINIPMRLFPGSPAAASAAAQLGVTQAQAIAYYDSFVNAPGYPYVVAYNRPNEAEATSWGLSATVEYDFGPATLKSITAYRNIQDYKAIDVDGVPLDLYRLDPFRSWVGQFTQELQLNGDLFGNRLHYTLGAFYYDFLGRDFNQSHSLVNNPNSPATANARVSLKSYAVYGQATFDITHNLHLTGGLRWTDVSKDLFSRNRVGPTDRCNVPPPAGVGGAPCEGLFPFSENNLSYTASLDWNITDDVMMYIKTSRGFNSGGVNQRLTANPSSTIPFLSERVTDYEVGIRSEFFDRRVRLNATYYHTDYANIQRTVFAVINNITVSVIQNAAAATVDGVEADLRVVPVDNLVLQGTLGYTRPAYQTYFSGGVDLSGLRFNQVSEWTYSLSAGYTIPASFGSAQLQLDWAWRSNRDLFPAGGSRDIDVQPGYGLLNAQVRFNIRDWNMDVRLYAKNILDKVYIQQMFDTSPGLGVVAGFPGTPRTFGVIVTRHF